MSSWLRNLQRGNKSYGTPERFRYGSDFMDSDSDGVNLLISQQFDKTPSNTSIDSQYQYLQRKRTDNPIWRRKEEYLKTLESEIEDSREIFKKGQN